MPRSKISQMAQKENKTDAQLLVELFDKHGSMVAVANELNLNVSTISVAVLRAGLKCKTIVIPKDIS